MPAGGGVGTARAIAHAYGAFAAGGRELGLEETLDLLAAPAIPPARGFYDECLKGEGEFSLGFMKPSVNWRFGGARSFGSPGTGGALGLCRSGRRHRIRVCDQPDGHCFHGDPRDRALRHATLLRAWVPSASAVAAERIASLMGFVSTAGIARNESQARAPAAPTSYARHHAGHQAAHRRSR